MENLNKLNELYNQLDNFPLMQESLDDDICELLEKWKNWRSEI